MTSSGASIDTIAHAQASDRARHVDLSIRDGVATITLARPAVLNSLNRAMLIELRDQLVRADCNPAVRCVVLTGSGRGFCAGFDVSELVQGTEAGPDAIREILNDAALPLLRTLIGSSKPIIACVNGVAAGAGVSLAAACDLIVASSTARFTLSFVHLGLVPDLGATFLIPRVIGWHRAAALMLTGDSIDADGARAIGLVHAVAPPSEIEEKSRHIADQLSSQSATVLGLIKHALNASAENSMEAQLALETELQVRAAATAEHTAAVAAFVSKRARRVDSG